MDGWCVTRTPFSSVGTGTLGRMAAASDAGSADGLGALLVLLHGADAPFDTVQAAYRVWRHRDRSEAAFMAHAEAQDRRARWYGRRGAPPEPAESEETVRIWRAGERARVEHHGGEQDGYYAVSDGSMWWVWSEGLGARSNQDDPTVGGNFTNQLQIMLNPVALLSSLRFRPVGKAQIAGRPTITAHGTPRPQDPDRGGAFELHELGTGADYYELEVDRRRGGLLAVTAIYDGQPFHTITTLELEFDRPIPKEIFRFTPPAGEEIEPLRGMHRLRFVTLTEAQRQAPFTVLMPDSVPHDWQVQCRFIDASDRPPSPVEIGLSYDSVDGHESVSLTQTAAGASNPHTRFLDEENWENVTRDGISMRTRPADWGQAQVELELAGTWVHLMSDNLTRDQVLRIAAGLRPAPSTSRI